MFSTRFEPEGSSSRRRLYIELLYGTFTFISISSLEGRRVCSIRLPYRTVPYHNIIVYTTVCLNLNPQVRNV